MSEFLPDVVAPKEPRETDIVAILMTVGDAHKLAVSDGQVGMLVRLAITARLVNPPHGLVQQTRAELVAQERRQRWALLYDAMRDDLNLNA